MKIKGVMKASYKFFLRIFLVLCAFYLFGKYFTDIAIYVVISMVFTTLLLPLTERLVHVSILGIQLSRTLAAFVSFLVLLCGFSVFISLFIPLIEEQITTITSIDGSAFDLEVKQIIYKVETSLLKYHIIEHQGDVWSEIELIKHSFLQQIKINNLFSMFFSITGSLFVGVMAVTFMTFFFLREKGKLRQTFLQLVPNQYFEFSITAYHKIQTLLVSYLTGLLIQMFIIFTVTSLGLSIVGVKYAITIGFFTAIANLIPYFGPFLGAIFGIAVGLSTSSTLGTEVSDYMFFILKIIMVFGTVQLTDNVLIQPIIFSKSVKAHPLEIFVIIFAGANLGGVLGMIYAIPVYTIIKVAIVELGFGYSQYHIFKN
jgi:predicted PurR-regulated permease PerM